MSEHNSQRCKSQKTRPALKTKANSVENAITNTVTGLNGTDGTGYLHVALAVRLVAAPWADLVLAPDAVVAGVAGADAVDAGTAAGAAPAGLVRRARADAVDKTKEKTIRSVLPGPFRVHERVHRQFYKDGLTTIDYKTTSVNLPWL